MTGKEVETVATLLKRVRERAEAIRTRDRSDTDVAEGLKSLAAAVEMCAIDLAGLRHRLESMDHAMRHLAKRTERR